MDGSQQRGRLSRAQMINSFIKDPYDTSINPRYLIRHALDRKRAESILKKIDKIYQTENTLPEPPPSPSLIPSFSELMTQMKAVNCIDKKLKKLLLENIYRNPLESKEERRDLWFYASGAKIRKDLSNGYYTKLRQETNFPEHFSQMIEKDLKRTFPEKTLDPNDQTIPKMRAILNSYAKRNSNIGYCQGLNFIVARILEVIEDEEDSFWVFTVLLEDILPIDYFSSMVGVLIDQRIFGDMIRRHDKYLYRKFSLLEVDPSLFSLQWFVCCYVSTFSDNLCNAVWDLLFLEGANILFKVGLIYLSSLRSQFLKAEEFNQIFILIEENNQFSMDVKEFYKKVHPIYMSKRMLSMIRGQYQRIIEQELQVLESKKRNKSLLISKESPVCNLDWPVCLDVLEKSKKKKNTSTFSLSRKNKDQRKNDQVQFLMEVLEGGLEDKQSISEKHELNLPVLEIISKKSSEYSKETHEDCSLVMGRHDHTCPQALAMISPTKNPAKHKMKSGEKAKNFFDGDPQIMTRKTMIGKPKSRLRNETKTLQNSYKSFAFGNQDRRLENAGGPITNFIKGLFGTNVFRKPPNEDITKLAAPETRPKGLTSYKTSPTIYYSSSGEDSPSELGKEYEYLEEDDQATTRPRRSLYHFIVDSNFTESDDSSRKSFMFLRDFFPTSE